MNFIEVEQFGIDPNEIVNFMSDTDENGVLHQTTARGLWQTHKVIWDPKYLLHDS